MLRQRCLSILLIIATSFSVIYAQSSPTESSSIGVSSHWPDNPDDINGWISYAIHIAIVFAFMLLLGSAITITIWVFCCCARPSTPKAFGKFEKKRWIIIYSIFYGLLFVMGLIIIAMAATTSNGINKTVNSFETAVDALTIETPAQITQALQDLEASVLDLVRSVNETLEDRGFDGIHNALAALESRVNNTYDTIQSINNALNDLQVLYDRLLVNMTYLQSLEAEGYLEGVPQNDTYHDSIGENDNFMSNAMQQFDNFNNELDSAHTSVQDAETTFRNTFNTEVVNFEEELNSLVNDAISTIENFSNDIRNSIGRDKIEEIDDKYIQLQNSLRTGLVIAFVLINMLAYGVWYIGVFTKKQCLLISPVIFAAIFAWWIMLLAAVHFALWIPIRDTCNNAMDYITRPEMQENFGINSGNNSGDIFQDMVNTLLKDPAILLECQGDETLFSRLNLSVLDQFPDINDTLSDFRSEVENAVADVDTNSTIEEAISAIQTLKANISSMQSNAQTYYNDIELNRAQLANITEQLTDPWDNFGVDPNAHIDALKQLNDLIEAYIGDPDYVYDFTNFTEIDFEQSPFDTLDPNQEQEIADAISAVNATYNAFLFVEETTQEVLDTVNHMNTTLGEILIQVQIIEAYIQAIENHANSAHSELEAVTKEQMDFINFVLDEADKAIADVLDLLNFHDVGKCAWLGDFWRDGYEQGFCSTTNGSLGAAAFFLFFFSILMLVGTLIIYFSKEVMITKDNCEDDNL